MFFAPQRGQLPTSMALIPNHPASMNLHRQTREAVFRFLMCGGDGQVSANRRPPPSLPSQRFMRGGQEWWSARALREELPRATGGGVGPD
jgi:hypothetical protein